MLYKISKVYTNQKNACRALHRLVEASGITLKLPLDAYQIPVKMRKPSLGKCLAWWPFFTMKTWAVYLLEHFPKHLLAGYSLKDLRWQEALVEFWSIYRTIDPGHEIYQAGLDLRCVVPYFFHGDEGRSHGKDPFLVLSWQPVVGFKGLSECNDSS